MGFSVKNNFLNESDATSVREFLYNSEWWSEFSGDDTTKRRAFSVTYKKEDIPENLKEFITEKHNVYHFMGIETCNSGSISEHVDCDFQEIFISENPGGRIGLPETVVYYSDIDPEMVGGELILNDYIPPIKPKNNMAVILESNTPHAVNAVVEAKKPRLVLVCERYYILSKYINLVESPKYRDG